VTIAPVSAAGADTVDELRADLDGKPIELVEVGKWYCHDLDYPAIHCFSDPAVLEEKMVDRAEIRNAPIGRFADARADNQLLAATGSVYVTVYEFTTYQGAYMHMAQDYSMLSVIGWNDRISSFVAKNGQSGVFWTDWLYTGTRFSFCCNGQFGSLGGFNDSFSSLFRG
jgi:hypothetical protein